MGEAESDEGMDSNKAEIFLLLNLEGVGYAVGGDSERARDNLVNLLLRIPKYTRCPPFHQLGKKVPS